MVQIGSNRLSRKFQFDLQSDQRILMHAPNIHIGGGLVLLKKVLATTDTRLQWAQLDMRAKSCFFSPPGMQVWYVKHSFMSRLMAEWRLWRACFYGDVVLCFNSLPPLLPLRGRVVVFVQNRLLIEPGSLAEYPFIIRARLWVERLWGRMLQRRCSRYIVQTPSMAAALKRWLWREVPISVMPFVPERLSTTNTAPDAINRKFDFVYVASGEAHKNHNNLIEAWRLIVETGYRPSLALTVDNEAHPTLCEHIDQASVKLGLAVTNLGKLSSEEVAALYQTAGALIYPSKSESLGLPLIEAAQSGLPILASELDYVRDLIEPVETFDPNSPLSIARAVRRFLGVAETPLDIGTAAAFLAEVLR